MSHRHAWLCCAVLALAACKPEPAATTAPVETPQPVAPATPEAIPATPAQGPAVATQLAALTPDQLAIDSPAAAQYLGTFFKDGCSKDEGLPFDQSCQHYAEDAGSDDPSPWPDLALGIHDGHIVSAVLFDPQQSLGAGWTCEAVSGPEHVRACAPVAIPAGQRAEWLQRWSAYLTTAD